MSHIGWLGITLLCAAVLGHAQVSFEPQRLDDGQARLYYYPNLVLGRDSTLRCGWAETTADYVRVYGRRMGLDGQSVTPPEVLLEGSSAVYSCPPELHLVELPGGGEARLTYHA